MQERGQNYVKTLANRLTVRNSKCNTYPVNEWLFWDGLRWRLVAKVRPWSNSLIGQQCSLRCDILCNIIFSRSGRGWLVTPVTPLYPPLESRKNPTRHHRLYVVSRNHAFQPSATELFRFSGRRFNHSRPWLNSRNYLPLPQGVFTPQNFYIPTPSPLEKVLRFLTRTLIGSMLFSAIGGYCMQ